MVFQGRDSNGKRRFHIKTIKGAKKAALQYAREIETAISTGAYVEPSKQSVEQYLIAWLAGKSNLRSRSRESYQKLIMRYMVPALGDRKLANLRAPEIKKLYADMEVKGLSPRTIRYTHSVLKSAMRAAVIERLVVFNPTDSIKPPSNRRREMKFLSAPETVRFLVAARDDRWHALWEILALAGLRPGEALGLKWSDLSGNVLTIQRALVSGGSAWKAEKPKNGRHRCTPLADSAMKALQMHRKRQAAERLRAGASYQDNDFIFASEKGLPLDIKNVTARHFRKVLRAAGLDVLRLYDLRHTAATLMLSAGVSPKVASERLGHSTIVLTMDTYSHVMPGMQQDAVERVERLLAAAGA